MKLWHSLNLLVLKLFLFTALIPHMHGISIGLDKLVPYPTVTATQGLWVIALLLPFYLAEQLGLLPIDLTKLKVPSWRLKAKRDVSSNSYFQSDSFFRHIDMADRTNCVLRYICELAGQKEDVENALEFVILRLATKYDTTSGPSSAQEPFVTAFTVGQKNNKACSVQYKNCPYGLLTLRNFMKEVK